MFGKRPVDRVDFVVAGVQKAGTTAIHYFLSKHPHIALLRDQALHFFDNEANFKAEPDYKILHGNFAPKWRWRIAGEATSDYLYWPTAIERIARYNPRMKIIASLRNPADRAFSHWNMRRARDQEPLDFIPAVDRDRATTIEPFSLQMSRYAYVDRSRYVPQLERLFRYFPREQVMVIKHENFRRDYAGIINQIFDFLGVKRLPALRNRERNTGPYQRKMTAEEREHASQIFADEIPKVEALLGWDCSDWYPRNVNASQLSDSDRSPA
jgi:hypothetical protein